MMTYQIFKKLTPYYAVEDSEVVFERFNGDKKFIIHVARISVKYLVPVMFATLKMGSATYTT